VIGTVIAITGVSDSVTVNRGITSELAEAVEELSYGTENRVAKSAAIDQDQRTGRIMSNEFRATSPVTASDPMTEMDLAVLLVDHGLGVDSMTLALTSPWLWPLVLPSLQSHTSGSY
jgi:hypothetical protein